MNRWLFLFALGAVSSLIWPVLPSLFWCLPALGMALWLRQRGCLAAIPIVLGICWCLGFFTLQLGWLENLTDGDRLYLVAGQVVERQQRGDGVQLVVQASRLDTLTLWPAPRIRLGWYAGGQPIEPGDSVVVRARLKPYHGLGNPSGFNAERWLLGEGITATGTIKQWLEVQSRPPGLRDRWLAQARVRLASLPNRGLLLALVFGEQQAVAQPVWQLLREAGIIHLLAISGLHVGLAYGLGALLARFLLGRVPGWRPHHAWLAGFLLALFYAWLANFSLPTLRALLMLAIWLGCRLWARHWRGLRVWLCAFCGLLVWDPWSLFSLGFWLSFLAVAAIFLALFLWRHPGLLKLQLWLALVLLPAQLLLFGGLSLVAIPVNLLAVPYFCLLLIPLGLLSGLLLPLWPALAAQGFWLADRLLAGLLWGLDWLSQWQASWVWLTESSQILLLLGWFTLLVWYWPSGRPLSMVGLLAVCLWWWQPAPRWRVDVIDVGQGLAVLISQGDEGLLFDTGDAYPGGYNLADAAILPLLHYRGIERLDTLVVSHDDRDHAANWRRLRAALPVRQLLSSAPLAADQRTCRRGDSWQWHALRVEVMSPQVPRDGRHNEDSCVLRIGDGRFHVLLTGDLQGQAERQLAALGPEQVAAELLVSPHHGSRTSSSPALVAAVAPTLVVHSSGYRNRWHFPHPQVVARYGAARQWNTARDGLVSVSVSAQGWQAEALREHAPWYRRLDAWLAGRLPVE